MTSAEARPEVREGVADWTFQGSAMFGAALGALTGVTVAHEVAVGPYAAVLLGTAGTILGSVVCALVGRFLVLPTWMTLFKGESKQS